MAFILHTLQECQSTALTVGWFAGTKFLAGGKDRRFLPGPHHFVEKQQSHGDRPQIRASPSARRTRLIQMYIYYIAPRHSKEPCPAEQGTERPQRILFFRYRSAIRCSGAFGLLQCFTNICDGEGQWRASIFGLNDRVWLRRILLVDLPGDVSEFIKIMLQGLGEHGRTLIG